MADTIKKLTIEGFKSIRKLEDFELRPLNVLIGANGAGKSNFVGFFRLLRDLVDGRLQIELQRTEGGADGTLYLGPKVTEMFAATLDFGGKSYGFSLAPTTNNGFVFSDEAIWFSEDGRGRHLLLGAGHLETNLKVHNGEGRYPAGRIFDVISTLVVHHFDDTSLNAAVRRQRSLNDNEALRPNAENLAPFLYRILIADRKSYVKILEVVRLATPFFCDFHLRPIPTNPSAIQLEWQQKGTDYPFRASQLSDGTLRFICLATALLQPSPPPLLLFDEPELGLHPYALTLLGGLFKQVAASGNTQIIVSTQSAQLLNEFAPEDIIVVERTEEGSTFERLKSEKLSEWLEEYTLGDLWQKNVLGGSPREDRSLEPVPGDG